MVESRKHIQQKERIRDIARRKGLIAELEVPFICWSGYHGKVIWYSVDIFVCSNRGGTPIIIEIDGYRGHSSKYQSGRDKRRTQDIQALLGDNIVVRRYTLEELKIATDEEIEKDLGI